MIIGKLIPAATGLKRYRRIEIEPSEPLPARRRRRRCSTSDELAAELGLGDGDLASALRRRLRARTCRTRGDRRRRRRDGLRRGARRARRPARRGRRAEDARRPSAARPRRCRLGDAAAAVDQPDRGGSVGTSSVAPGRCAAHCVARLVERVVDPGQRPLRAGVGVDRRELPVRVLAAPGFGRSSGRVAAPGSPARAGRWSLARSSQPLHQTSSKNLCSASRCAPALAERKWAIPSAWIQAPGGRSSDVKPNSEITPSMSTRSSGTRWFAGVYPIFHATTASLSCCARSTLCNGGSVNVAAPRADDSTRRRRGTAQPSGLPLNDPPTRHPACAALRRSPRTSRSSTSTAGRARRRRSTSRTRSAARAALWGSKWFAIGMARRRSAPGCCTSRRSRSPRSRSSRRSLAGGVALIAVMADRIFGFKVGRRQWWGLGLTAVGLILLGDHDAAHRRLALDSFSIAAMIAFQAGLLGVGALLIIGPRRRRARPSTTASCSPPPRASSSASATSPSRRSPASSATTACIGARQPVDRCRARRLGGRLLRLGPQPAGRRGRRGHRHHRHRGQHRLHRRRHPRLRRPDAGRPARHRRPGRRLPAGDRRLGAHAGAARRLRFGRPWFRRPRRRSRVALGRCSPARPYPVGLGAARALPTVGSVQGPNCGWLGGRTVTAAVASRRAAARSASRA